MALIGYPSAGKSTLVSVRQRRPAQDRRLPVHHPRAQPGRRHRRRAAVHGRRRPRSDPRRERGQGPRPGVPAPRRALLGPGARHRLRDPGAGPRPAQRPRRDRARARAVRPRRHPGRPAALRPHPDDRAQQGRRARGARARRDGQARPGGPRARGVHRLGGRPHRAARADVRDGPPRQPRPGRALEVVVPPRIVLRPKAVDDSGFVVKRENTPDGEVFRIVGERPTRWVHQTDFSNDEAVGYLADRLARAGVEEALFKAGAVAGATVVIGSADNAVVFDWEPTMSAGAELLTGPRGIGRAAGRPAPSDPRGEARGLRRPPRLPHRGARGARGRAPRRPLGRRGQEDEEVERQPRTAEDGTAGRRPVRGRRRRPAARSLDFGRVQQPPHALTAASRLVVKVGSSSLTTGRASSTWRGSHALVDVLAARRRSRPPRSCSCPRAPSRPGIGPLGLARRPRDLATQQAAASVGQGALRRGVPARPSARARPHRRPGPADRRRRDPALALRQRAAHPRPAARPRRRPRRQRERHRGHARDPRSATTTGWPRWSPTSSHADALRAALRRRRAVRRAAQPAPARRGSRWCVGRADLDAVRDRRHRLGRRHAAAWRPRSRRPASPRPPGSRPC